MKTSTIVWWIVGIIIVLGIAWAVWAYSNANTANAPGAAGTSAMASSTNPTADEAAVSAVVTAFGTHLQNVSLLAADASSTMASEYGSYVDPTLLASWEANPANAPGRQTSSPWPGSISVTSVLPSSTGYVVQGGINMVTSTGPASQTPFTAQVAQENGQWYIISFSTN